MISDFKGVAKHLDVFVYFDIGAKVHAPFDAIRMARQFKAEWSPPLF